ncbi:hypothetical protein EAI_03961, partial [Harpegnathos saltator]
SLMSILPKALVSSCQPFLRSRVDYANPIHLTNSSE